MEAGELSRREGWVQIGHPISAVEGWVSARRLSEVPSRAEEAKTEEQPKPKKTERPGVEVLSDVAIIARLIALDAAPIQGIVGARRTRIERAGDAERGVRTLSPVAVIPYVTHTM